MERNAVLNEIYATLENINKLRAPNAQIARNPDTVLYGESGSLDSIGLVSLLMDVEYAVSERAGKSLSLIDENAMSQRRNPFRTVGSLADYILGQLGSKPE
jgi:acyl carrier protein